MKSKFPIILIVLIAVVLIVLVVFIIKIKADIPNIRGKRLTAYSCGSGGGMNGGGSSTKISLTEDGRALISTTHKNWYYQDETVSEYITDRLVLDELEAVVRKYGMNKWHNKTFTKQFVFDGESTGYSFTFMGEDQTPEFVSFSSQIYPARYLNKLEKLQQIEEKYLSSAEKLPGLVIDQAVSAAEETGPREPEKDVVSVSVYKYLQNCVYFRVGNGTGKTVLCEFAISIDNEDTGEHIADNQGKYISGSDIEPGEFNEEYIKLKVRLACGHYTITVGDFTGRFEIR